MVHGVRTGEGRGVGAAAEEVQGVQRKGLPLPKGHTMFPSMCANMCATWGGTCTNVWAVVGGEAAMVHGVQTREGRGVGDRELAASRLFSSSHFSRKLM
jgi:hypothetical protein